MIVFNPDLSKVLLNLHAKAQRWFAFGGHLEDGDETLLHAAAREGREESGLATRSMLLAEPVHLSCHPVDFCDPRGRVHHYDVRFAAVAPTGSKPEVSDESSDVRWFAVDDLPTDEPDMLDLISLAADRLRRS
ncbi:MAG: NUDIX domain-containing protein [Nocardioidaceae bacterium]